MTPTTSDVQVRILEEIIKVLDTPATIQAKAGSVRDLAEAWAWFTSPDQPHGGATKLVK
jgi:hypothetical protein